MGQYLANTQRVSYKTVAFPLAEFEEKEMPAEEQLKKHWEENKGGYLSKPMRRISSG